MWKLIVLSSQQNKQKKANHVFSYNMGICVCNQVAQGTLAITSPFPVPTQWTLLGQYIVASASSRDLQQKSLGFRVWKVSKCNFRTILIISYGCGTLSLLVIFHTPTTGNPLILSLTLIGNKIAEQSGVYCLLAPLQLHLHSRLNTWHPWNEQKPRQDEARNI